MWQFKIIYKYLTIVHVIYFTLIFNQNIGGFCFDIAQTRFLSTKIISLFIYPIIIIIESVFTNILVKTTIYFN